MISVVVTTFNSEKFVESCLDSVLSQQCPNLEVIIVDNGSQDKTRDIIKKKYPQIVLVENKKNFGSCEARNQGIELSHGEWILTLDCDVVIEDNFFSKINKRIAAIDSDLGMFQPKILQYDRKTIFSCGLHLSWLRRFYDIGRNKIDGGQYDSLKYIFGASSACACYRRRMLEDIKEDTGYFDKRFFFLVEDVDLAWRAQRKGWKALFYPEAVCCHCGNSSGTNRQLRQYLCFRNRYYTIMKNEGFIRYSLKIFPLLFYDLPRLLYMAFANPCIFKGLKLDNR